MIGLGLIIGGYGVMYTVRTLDLNRSKTKGIGGNEVLGRIIADIDHLFAGHVQDLAQLLKAKRGWLPELSTELLGKDNVAEVLFDFQSLDLQSLGR